MAPYSGIRIYAGGKISQNGWRHSLFPIHDDADPTNPAKFPWPDEIPIRGLPGAVYVGPHFMSDDHGCYHGPNAHGVAAGGWACGDAYPGLSRPDVTRRCLSAIQRSTHLFVWIDEPTAHGTLVELGYARALGKQAHVYLKRDRKELDDLWFAGQIATAQGQATDAAEAWEDFRLRLR